MIDSSPTQRAPADPAARLDRARRIYRVRRRRTDLFGANGDLFAEPAWDLLLDLYIAGTDGRAVSVSSACIAAGVPATTGLRWIGRLDARGLVARTPDPTDARREFLALTPAGRAAMEAVLDEP